MGKGHGWNQGRGIGGIRRNAAERDGVSCGCTGGGSSIVGVEGKIRYRPSQPFPFTLLHLSPYLGSFEVSPRRPQPLKKGIFFGRKYR